VHVNLERVRSGRRRVLAPQRVDQPVARHDPAAGHQQAREQRDLSSGRELAGVDLHGAKDAEIHT
jgi:hypothetical protein